jgi:hypothetical protein
MTDITTNPFVNLDNKLAKTNYVGFYQPNYSRTLSTLPKHIDGHPNKKITVAPALENFFLAGIAHG